MSVDLRVDWCDYKAAKFAVEHWHYSRTMPVSKPTSIGVWENGAFIGVVIFALGASPSLGSPYGLTMFQCCELVRVALTDHKTQVSEIVSKAMKMLKKRNSGLRLIVSFADPFHGHNGAIYQAMNWVYVGTTQSAEMLEIDGKLVDPRRFNGHGWNKKKAIPKSAIAIRTPGKHRYLYPLDRAMRKQIAPLAKPYPKREAGGQSVEGDTSGDQPEEAGSIPAARSIIPNDAA